MEPVYVDYNATTPLAWAMAAAMHPRPAQKNSRTFIKQHQMEYSAFDDE
jgi:cysteine sulfinate desulfinase/cysteine desulfurase-like protein